MQAKFRCLRCLSAGKYYGLLLELRNTIEKITQIRRVVAGKIRLDNQYSHRQANRCFRRVGKISSDKATVTPLWTLPQEHGTRSFSLRPYGLATMDLEVFLVNPVVGPFHAVAKADSGGPAKILIDECVVAISSIDAFRRR